MTKLPTPQQRTQNGEVFRSTFNMLFDKATEQYREQHGEEGLSYRDMMRITEALTVEGPAILGVKRLPQLIHAGLYYAIAAVDPEKARSKENLKKGMSAVSGTAGLTLATACLAQLINPGVWALITAFFLGGVAGGPLAIAGIGAGIATAAAAIYVAFQKMTPKERAKKAHECVNKAITKWIEKGSDDEATQSATPEPEEAIEQSSIHNDLILEAMTEEEWESAVYTLFEVANADGNMAKEEMELIMELLGGDAEFYSDLESPTEWNIKTLKKSSTDIRKQVACWCYAIAMADNNLDFSEEEKVRSICKKLDINYKDIAQLFGK